MIKFWQIFTITLLICSCFLIGCEESGETSALLTQDNLPQKQADSVMVVTTNKNRIEQKLFANHLDEYEDGLAILDSVYIENYNLDGTIKYTLRCDKAEVNQTEKILTAIDNVIIISENGVLKTSFLTFNQENELIHAPHDVLLTRNENTLYGKNLKTDIHFEKIEISHVSAEGKIDEATIDW